MGVLSARNIISENVNTVSQKIKVINDEQLKLLQQCELEMLRNINNAACKNGLHLMLGGGTLLGAVRHKGFIPWDDDIDLMLMRNEVKSFLLLIESQFSDIYEIQYAHEEYEHYMSFIKIRKKESTYIELGYENLPNTNGVYLDIFIVENIPNNKIYRTWHGMISNFLLYLGPSMIFFNFESAIEKRMYTMSLKGRILYNIRKLLGFIFSWKSVSEWYLIMDNYFQKFAGLADSIMVTIPTGRRHYFGEMLPRTYFADFVLLPFEDIQVYAPIAYTEYLLNLYGDTYMEIPPAEKREKHYVIDFDFHKRKDFTHVPHKL